MRFGKGRTKLENQTNKSAQPTKLYPIGRVIIACIIGMLVGSFQPMMLMMSMTLCVMPILLCVLYAWAGWIPAAASAVVTLMSTASSAQMLGIDPTLMTAGAVLLMIAPAAAMIYATEKRMKFFHRLAVGIGAHIAALMIAVTVLYAGLKIDFFADIRSHPFLRSFIYYTRKWARGEETFSVGNKRMKRCKEEDV